VLHRPRLHSVADGQAQSALATCLPSHSPSQPAWRQTGQARLPATAWPKKGRQAQRFPDESGQAIHADVVNNCKKDQPLTDSLIFCKFGSNFKLWLQKK